MIFADYESNSSLLKQVTQSHAEVQKDKWKMNNISTPLYTLVANVNCLELYSPVSFPSFIRIPTGVYTGRAGSCVFVFH